MNGEGGEVDDTGGGFGVDLVEWDVEDGAIGLAQVIVWDVGSDADDLVDRLIGAAFKSAADGVQAREEGRLYSLRGPTVNEFLSPELNSQAFQVMRLIDSDDFFRHLRNKIIRSLPTENNSAMVIPVHSRWNQ